MGGAENGGGCACVGAGRIWELTIPSLQFCCELKTSKHFFKCLRPLTQHLIAWTMSKRRSQHGTKKIPAQTFITMSFIKMEDQKTAGIIITVVTTYMTLLDIA